MPAKTKQTQKEDLEKANGRDNFQTPNYAVDLLVPYLNRMWYIWECAAGGGKIVDRLIHYNFCVFGSDIAPDTSYQRKNFLTDDPIHQLTTYGKEHGFCIVTNPPFSLKKKFYLKCMEYGLPFALLIPSDISGWVLSAFDEGCKVIVPNRRIDYLTPNILNRINNVIITLTSKLSVREIHQRELINRAGYFVPFVTVGEVPVQILRAFSSSDFHSWWLTKGLNLEKQINIVELSNAQKDNI